MGMGREEKGREGNTREGKGIGKRREGKESGEEGREKQRIKSKKEVRGGRRQAAT